MTHPSLESTVLTIEIEGEPFTRGVSYGTAAAARILASLAYYREALTIQTGLSWDAILTRTKRWHDAATTFAPDLMEEIKGIAHGADVTFDEIFLLNVRGEVVYDSHFDQLAPTVETDDTRADDGCTSFALMPEATGDLHVYAGQNWDWRHGTRDTLVLVRVVLPTGIALIFQTEAGQVSRQGANSAGIALNANGLGGRFANSVGVPQTFIRRKALESATYAEALEVIVNANSQIASNALLTTREGFAIDLETTPGSHDWLYPDDGILVHGNHYQGRIPTPLQDTYRPRSVSSLYRVERARAGLTKVRNAAGSDAVRDAIHTAMSDTLGYPDSLCCYPLPLDPDWKQWSTVLSSCVDLTTGDYFYTPRPPRDNAYRRAPWNLYH